MPLCHGPEGPPDDAGELEDDEEGEHHCGQEQFQRGPDRVHVGLLVVMRLRSGDPAAGGENVLGQAQDG